MTIKLIARALRAKNDTMESFLVLWNAVEERFSLAREQIDNNGENRILPMNETFIGRIRELQLFDKHAAMDGSRPVFFTPCFPGKEGAKPEPENHPEQVLESAVKIPASYIQIYGEPGESYFAFRCLLRVFLFGDQTGQVAQPELPLSVQGYASSSTTTKAAYWTKFFPHFSAVLAGAELFKEDDTPFFRLAWLWRNEDRRFRFDSSFRFDGGRFYRKSLAEIATNQPDQNSKVALRNIQRSTEAVPLQPTEAFLESAGLIGSRKEVEQAEAFMRLFILAVENSAYILGMDRLIYVENDHSRSTIFPSTGHLDATVRSDALHWPFKKELIRARQLVGSRPFIFKAAQTPYLQAEIDHWCSGRVEYGLTLEVNGLNQRWALRQWQRLVGDPIAQSISILKDGSGFSAIPKLTEVHSSNQSWLLYLRAVDVVPDAASWEPTSLRWPASRPDLIRAKMLAPKFHDQEVSVALTLPQFQTAQGQDIHMNGVLTFGGFREDGMPNWEEIGSSQFFFRFLLMANPVDQDPWVARLGALDLHFPMLDEHDQVLGALEVRTQIVNESPRVIGPRFSSQCWLGLSRIAAGGQDDMPGDDFLPPLKGEELLRELDLSEQLLGSFQRARPVVFPLGLDGEAEFYVLKMDESSSVDTDHGIVLTIFDEQLAHRLPDWARAGLNPEEPRETDENADLALVFDREPYSLVWVDLPPLRKPPGALDTIVATWDSADPAGAHWRLPGQDPIATWLLPPQAVGEAMEKSNQTGRDIDDGDRVPYRFSPLSPLEIVLEERARNVPPSWDIRLLLNDSSGDRPGVRLNKACYEMQYGMTNRLSAEYLRLADLESYRGQPVRLEEHRLRQTLGDQGQNQPSFVRHHRLDKYRDWARAYSAWKTRMGYWEVRSGLDLDGRLVLSQGIDFQLRKNQLFKDPLPYSEADKPEDYEQWFHEDGLAGGPLWGFESANILNSVLRDPYSSGGELKGLSFTAHGAWGKQTARFDRNRSAIITHASAGRSHFYSIERVGRISVFWNRAKHVIIYERSVVPSDQFAHDQNEHLGRTIIRKVDEYVEILEPARRYPEGDVSPATTGFVQGTEFRHKLIRVDSRWGRDVGDVGWEVPLWNTDTLDSSISHVYPKPQIELQVTGDKDLGPEILRCNIENPENVYFFASTRIEDNDQTDVWPAFEYVDFVDLPDDRPNEKALARSDFRNEHDDRTMLAAPPEIPHGLSRFTWSVQSYQRVNLTAFRLPKPITTRLRTVTMMRASEQNLQIPDGPGLEKRLALAEATQSKDQSAAIQEAIREYGDVLLEQLPRWFSGNIHRDKQRLEDEAEAWFRTKGRKFKQAFNRIHNLQQKGQELLNLYADGELDSFCGIVKTQVTRELSSRRKQIVGRLDQAEQEIRKAFNPVFDRWQAHVGNLEESQLKDLREELRYALIGPLQQISGAPGVVQLAHKKLVSVLNRLMGFMELMRQRFLLALDELLPARVLALFENEFQPVLEDLSRLERRVEALEEEGVAAFQQGVASIAANQESILTARQKLLGTKPRILELIQTIKTKLSEITDQRLAPLAQPIRDILEALDVEMLVQGLANGLQATASFFASLPVLAEELENDFDQAKQNLKVRVEASLGGWRALERDWKTAVLEAKESVNRCFSEIQGRVETQRNALGEFFQNEAIGSQLMQGLMSVTARTRALQTRIEGTINDVTANNFKDQLRLLNESWDSQLDQIKTEIRQLLNLAEPEALARQYLDKICDQFTEGLNPGALFNNFQIDAETYFQQLVENLAASIQEGLDATLLECVNVIGNFGHEFAAKLDMIGTWLTDYAASVADAGQQILARTGDSVLRLLRAMGDPPSLPDLSFNRPALAYFFEDLLASIRLTPCTALLDRAGEHLRGIGIGLPSLDLDLDFKPPALPRVNLGNFDLSEILPDLGGIKLDGFFSGRKLNGLSSDAVKITHGIDKATRSAWGQADVNIPLGKGYLFQTEVFSVRVDRAELHAQLRMETDLNGQLSKRVKGKIESDWSIAAGGFSFMQMEDVLLEYTDKKGLRFKLDPNKVRFNGALQFLGNLIEDLNDNDSGLTFEMLERHGRPYGLRAMFDMALPNLSFGAFSITGMALGVHVDLKMESSFSIELHAFLGSELAPFSITVAFLGGGGFIDLKSLYRPSVGYLETRGQVALGAMAAAGFSLGPIEGWVSFFFGIRASFYSRTGQKDRFEIAAILIINGGCTIWGFISIGLNLTLLVAYDSTGRAEARGRISITIKISRFFKKSFKRSFTYTLKKGSGNDGGDRSSQALLSAAGATVASPAKRLEVANTPDFQPATPGEFAQNLILRGAKYYTQFEVLN